MRHYHQTSRRERHAHNAEVEAQVNKSRSNGKKEKEKIHVSTGEWRIIMSAIHHGMEVPANSRREVLMGISTHCINTKRS
jgi:hypothetical protein